VNYNWWKQTEKLFLKDQENDDGFLMSCIPHSEDFDIHFETFLTTEPRLLLKK